MKIYIASLAAGLVVGVVYSLLHVRSPAPPVVALVGLLGILIGEQLVPVVRNLIRGESLRAAIGLADCSHHVLGQLPGEIHGQTSRRSARRRPDRMRRRRTPEGSVETK